MANSIKANSDMINIDLDDNEIANQLMGHFPHGTSVRSIIHFSQMIRSNQFREYDYNKKKNLEVYGNKTAPLIPL